MKRKSTKAERAKSEPLRPVYTPERRALLERLTGALWEELQASLAAMLRELVAMGGGGEAPIIAGRARVKLMLGAMRGLEEDAQLLLVDRSEYRQHFRWHDELWRVMERWLAELEHDVAEYGVDDEDEEDSAYSSVFAAALGKFKPMVLVKPYLQKPKTYQAKDGSMATTKETVAVGGWTDCTPGTCEEKGVKVWGFADEAGVSI